MTRMSNPVAISDKTSHARPNSVNDSLLGRLNDPITPDDASRVDMETFVNTCNSMTKFISDKLSLIFTTPKERRDSSNQDDNKIHSQVLFMLSEFEPYPHKVQTFVIERFKNNGWYIQFDFNNKVATFKRKFDQTDR